MTTQETPHIVVIPSTPDYAGKMQTLQEIVYAANNQPDAEDNLTAEHFLSHLHYFPEAQFIAIDTDTDEVVGLTSGMRIHFDESQPYTHTWLETTANGTLSTHQPDGEWMYGVESAVHPDYQGMGIGGMLMAARFAVAQRLNLRGLVAGSVIMGYHKYADRMTPGDYVAAVVAGEIFDNNLSKQIKKGFRPHNIIPNYVCDTSSLGYGVNIIWHNPTYQPAEESTHTEAAH